MYKKRLTRFLLCMAALTFCLHSTSENREKDKLYIITFLNTKTIQIGDRQLRKGDTFYSGQTIHWKKDNRHTMRVRVIGKDGKPHGEEITCNREGFCKYKQKGLLSLFDYLTQERSLGTRGKQERKDHYSYKTHYLIDTLMLPTKATSVVLPAEAIWKHHDKEIITPISRSHDGRFYVISLDIYANCKPRDIKLSIRERDAEIEWINFVYRDIPIMFIPSSL